MWFGTKDRRGTGENRMVKKKKKKVDQKKRTEDIDLY